MCKKADESIDHAICGCSKLGEKEYKRRHDNLGKIVHWKLARKCNFEAGYKSYKHKPERRELVKSLILEFLEIVGLRRRRKRR